MCVSSKLHFLCESKIKTQQTYTIKVGYCLNGYILRDKNKFFEFVKPQMMFFFDKSTLSYPANTDNVLLKK